MSGTLYVSRRKMLTWSWVCHGTTCTTRTWLFPRTPSGNGLASPTHLTHQKRMFAPIAPQFQLQLTSLFVTHARCVCRRDTCALCAARANPSLETSRGHLKQDHLRRASNTRRRHHLHPHTHCRAAVVTGSLVPLTTLLIRPRWWAEWKLK